VRIVKACIPSADGSCCFAGDKIDCKIISIDIPKARVALSLKQTKPDPLEQNLESVLPPTESSSSVRFPCLSLRPAAFLITGCLQTLSLVLPDPCILDSGFRSTLRRCEQHSAAKAFQQGDPDTIGVRSESMVGPFSRSSVICRIE
jgi:hypothetical protein